MAGKELKATDKVVLKNSRDGVVEKNLADGSTTRVSGRLTEAVLKPSKTPEQLDKIKAAGLSPPEPRKRVESYISYRPLPSPYSSTYSKYPAYSNAPLA